MGLARRQEDRSPGQRVAQGFRSILLPVNTAQADLPADMVDVAARLAAERGSSIVLMAFTEVPLWEEMDMELPGLDEHVQAMGAEARSIARRYGVGLHLTAPRTRHVVDLILREARRRRAELVVFGATGRTRSDFRAVLYDSTTRLVSEEARVRTMVVRAPALASA